MHGLQSEKRLLLDALWQESDTLTRLTAEHRHQSINPFSTLRWLGTLEVQVKL